VSHSTVDQRYTYVPHPTADQHYKYDWFWLDVWCLMPLSAIFDILLYTNTIKNVSHSTVDQHYKYMSHSTVDKHDKYVAHSTVD
jgi:hypothetical protein